MLILETSAFCYDCDAPGQEKKVEYCLVITNAKGIALSLHLSLGWAPGSPWCCQFTCRALCFYKAVPHQTTTGLDLALKAGGRVSSHMLPSPISFYPRFALRTGYLPTSRQFCTNCLSADVSIKMGNTKGFTDLPSLAGFVPWQELQKESHYNLLGSHQPGTAPAGVPCRSKPRSWKPKGCQQSC